MAQGCGVYEPKDGVQKIVHFLSKKEENSELFNDYPGVKNCCFMRLHPLVGKRHIRVVLLINRASIFRDALKIEQSSELPD